MKISLTACIVVSCVMALLCGGCSSEAPQSKPSAEELSSFNGDPSRVPDSVRKQAEADSKQQAPQ